MRRLLILAVTTAFVAGLAAGPAGAQDINLGFSIDPVEGDVGDTVDGLVDVDDYNEICFTTPAEIGADTSTKMTGLVELWADNNPDPSEDEEAAAAVLGLFAILAGLPPGGDPDVPTLLFDNSRILAFLDLATQAPLGDISTFDPDTGEGSVTVPDLPPGTHLVGAICIQMISPDDPGALDAINGAIDEMVAFLATEPPPDELIAGLEPILFGLFGPLGLGLAPYCVVDATGECPAEEVPDNGEAPAEAVTTAPRFTG